MKKDKFADLVKPQCRKLALTELLERKATLSKMSKVEYSELKLQDIYQSKEIDSFCAKRLFMWKFRMFDLADNFKSKYSDLVCQLCGDHEDKDSLLLTCSKIRAEVMPIRTNNTAVYNDLYSDNIEKVKKIGHLLDAAFSKRKELLSCSDNAQSNN